LTEEAASQSGNSPAVPGRAPGHAESGAHGHAHEWPIHLGIIDKLKRRNVGRVAVLYVVVGYLLLEVFELFFHLLEFPAWTGKAVLLLLALGFPAALIFAWIYEVTPEGLKLSEQVHPAHSIAHHTGRRLDRAIIAVLAVALAYFVTDKFWLSRRAAPLAAAATTAVPAKAGAVNTTAAHAPPQSIAVLPLVNMSGDPAQQYFSDGLSESLITALTQFQGLKVIGRTSAFLFRDSKEDSRSIGAKLGVARLLEGSVQRSGGMVRVSAELIDTSDGSTQWSDRFDRPYKDLFALQDEITRAVAGALRGKLMPDGQAAVHDERPPSGSLEAYNALLQGRFYFWRDSEADIRKAIGFYTQAVEIDPRYAIAWSELSWGWASLGIEFLEGSSAQEAYGKARAAVDRALALSPNLASAYVTRGYLLLNADFKWREAEQELRRAVALAPNDAVSKFELGNLLATLGQLEPALELSRQALATEPLRGWWYNWLSIYLSALNRLDEAEQAVRRAIALDPTAVSYPMQVVIIDVKRGNVAAALAAAKRAPAGETYGDTALAMALQIGSDRAAADASLKSLIERHAGQGAYQIAQVYALRNDAEQTFAWLDRAWNNRDAGVTYLLYDPFILRFRNDPRFAAYCRKIGLPAPGEPNAGKPV
jgi:TolB-like protein/Tfp pilus assembly protein PilF